MNENRCLSCLVNDNILKLLRVLIRHGSACQPIVASSLLLQIFALLSLIKVEGIHVRFDASGHALRLSGLFLFMAKKVSGQSLREHRLLVKVLYSVRLFHPLFLCFGGGSTVLA